MADPPRPRLGEILVAQGLAPAAEVARALGQQSPDRLASALYRAGVASERALATGLAEQSGHPAVVLSESTLDLGALELVPRVLAQRHRVLPIAIDADTLTLAVAELVLASGHRASVFDQIEFTTGRRVQLYVAVEAVLREAIEAAYDAHRAGEAVLVGNVPRPPSVSALPPLALVRAAAAEADLLDPLQAPAGVPARTRTPVAVPTAPTKPQIFVVDDEDDIRALLRKLLTYDGYEVVEARTGREALERLRTLRPHAIILDAMLPELHGFDICATVKRSSTFKDTPVIVVSAVYKSGEHVRTVQEVHGADAFVEKPFDVHYLRQLVARLVGKELPKNQLSPDWEHKVKELREEANVAYQLGDLPAADDAVKRWRALDPFDPHAHLMLGAIRDKAKDLEGAMKAYERAATFDGNLYPAFKNLAVVYEQLGFVQRAAMAWSRARELAPDKETARRIEARLLRRRPVG